MQSILHLRLLTTHPHAAKQTLHLLPHTTNGSDLTLQAELDTVHPDAPTESTRQPPSGPCGTPAAPGDPPDLLGEHLEHRLLVGMLPVRLRVDQNVVLFLQAFFRAATSPDDEEPVYVEHPGTAQEASEPGTV